MYLSYFHINGSTQFCGNGESSCLYNLFLEKFESETLTFKGSFSVQYHHH